MQKYYPRIDILKGLLIILVISGHVIRASVDDSLIRWIIYSFHMPLFIAVSGFLMNQEFLKTASYFSLCKKYLKRLAIPWLLTWFAFLGLRSLLGGYSFFEIDFLNELIFPYHHLWYIPALFIFINILWVLKKINLNDLTILIGSIVVSFILMSYMNFFFVSDAFQSSEIIYNIVYIYKPHYFCFFVLGFYIRDKPIPTSHFLKICGILVLIMFSVRYYEFYFSFHQFSFLVFYPLNFGLICFALPYCQSGRSEALKFIQKIGINSLPIYLWHPLLRDIIDRVFFSVGNEIVYLITFWSMLGLIVLINNLAKHDKINRYIFGKWK